MGIFDNVQFTRYQSTRVGLPVEQLIRTASALNERYETSINNRDAISQLVNNTPVREHNAALLVEAADNIKSDLQQYYDSGDWDKAGLAIKTSADKHFLQNKKVRGAVEDYRQVQAFKAALDEGVKAGKYSSDWANKSYAMQVGIQNQPIDVDPNTKAVKNIFNPVLPPEEINANELALNIASKMAETTDVSQLQGTGLEGVYQQVLRTGKSPENIKNVVQAYLMTDPKYKAMIEYKSNLDFYHNFTAQGKSATVDDLKQLGLKVLDDGSIVAQLPDVPILDANGNDTGKTKANYTPPIANAFEYDPNTYNNIWKQVYKINNMDMPSTMAASAIGGYKVDIKHIKDEAHFERVRAANARSLMLEKNRLESTGKVGYTMLMGGSESKYSDITSLYNEFSAYENDFLPSINRLIFNDGTNTLTAKQRATLKYMVEHDTPETMLARVNSKAGSPQDVYWGDNIDFARKIVQATIARKQEYTIAKNYYQEGVNYLKSKGLSAPNLTADQIAKREQELTEKYIAALPLAMQASYKITGKAIIPESVRKDIKVNAIKSFGANVSTLTDWLSDDKNYMIEKTVQNFGDLNEKQEASLKADLFGLISQNATAGGTGRLINAKTGKEIVNENERAKILANKDSYSLGWVVNNDNQVVPVFRPIVKFTNKAVEQGDYIMMEGVIGLEEILSRYPTNANFINNERFTNQLNNAQGTWVKSVVPNMKVRTVIKQSQDADFETAGIQQKYEVEYLNTETNKTERSTLANTEELYKLINLYSQR